MVLYSHLVTNNRKCICICSLSVHKASLTSCRHTLNCSWIYIVKYIHNLVCVKSEMHYRQIIEVDSRCTPKNRSYGLVELIIIKLDTQTQTSTEVGKHSVIAV